MNNPREFRLLGRVEVSVAGETAALGGARQRAVLALLVLNAGEVVSQERIIDAVWGDSPPRAAAATVQVYISRLRKALTADAAEELLARSRNGYVLDIDPEQIDVVRFERLARDGEQALAAGDSEQAVGLLRSALALWRGVPLADVGEASFVNGERERLGELRVAAVEARIDAELELGGRADLIAELQRLTGEHPFRERLHAQLMLALYRSGRQAEALEVYDRVRRRLDDDLGLQPSRELQALAGRIVRQERDLQLAQPADEPPPGQRAAPRRSRRFALVGVAAAIVAGAVAAGALLATMSPDARVGGTPRLHRAALLALEAPNAPTEGAYYTLARAGLADAAQAQRLSTVALHPRRGEPELHFAQRVVQARPDLVFVFHIDAPFVIDEIMRRLPGARVVLLDDVIEAKAGLAPLSRVTGIVFREQQASYLAGYLSGLMEARPGPRLNRRHVVSVVGGLPTPPVQRWVRGFRSGVLHALPGAKVLVGYTNSFSDQAPCEQLANRQIDRGADIVFAAAGSCGYGALSAASVRGVWGVGVDGDLSYLGPHILVSAVKRMDGAIALAAQWAAEGRLPGGKNIVLGLSANAVGIAGISPAVPASIRRRVERVAQAIRSGELRVPAG